VIPRRGEALARLRSQIAAGRPIIGAGAGTGISAKFCEQGGVDLIITLRRRCCGPSMEGSTVAVAARQLRGHGGYCRIQSGEAIGQLRHRHAPIHQEPER
jgi:hypothetical protein